jgi:hypothetical protein
VAFMVELVSLRGVRCEEAERTALGLFAVTGEGALRMPKAESLGRRAPPDVADRRDLGPFVDAHRKQDAYIFFGGASFTLFMFWVIWHYLG